MTLLLQLLSTIIQASAHAEAVIYTKKYTAGDPLAAAGIVASFSAGCSILVFGSSIDVFDIAFTAVASASGSE